MKKTIIKQIFTILALQLFASLGVAQLSSIDVGLSTSKNEDVSYDQEYEYTNARSAAIFHITVGAKIKISPKFILTPKLAYSWNLQGFSKSFSTDEMIYLRKSKTLRYIKSGIGISYWITYSEKGFYIESELQGLINVSANSQVDRIIGNGEMEEFNVDFRDKVRTIMPSLRFGIGYYLRLSDNISMYLLYGKEIKASSNYTNVDGFRIFNSMVDIGFNYKLSHIKPNI